MSDFYNKYPYTDFHELNLDWVIERVKKLTEDWLATQQEWNDTEEQWQDLKNFVLDYFNNLDVQDEINNKINAMIADGTFEGIVKPIVLQETQTTVTNWLNEHVDPVGSAVIVDDTLSIEGAAADAAATGEAIRDLWLNLSETTYNMIRDSWILRDCNLDRNLNNISVLATVAGVGQYAYQIIDVRGIDDISLMIKTITGTSPMVRFGSAASMDSTTWTWVYEFRQPTTQRVVITSYDYLVVAVYASAYNGSNINIDEGCIYTDLMLTPGLQEYPYVSPLSAVDYNARNSINDLNIDRLMTESSNYNLFDSRKWKNNSSNISLELIKDGLTITLNESHDYRYAYQVIDVRSLNSITVSGYFDGTGQAQIRVGSTTSIDADSCTWISNYSVLPQTINVSGVSYLLVALYVSYNLAPAVDSYITYHNMTAVPGDYVKTYISNPSADDTLMRNTYIKESPKYYGLTTEKGSSRASDGMDIPYDGSDPRIRSIGYVYLFEGDTFFPMLPSMEFAWRYYDEDYNYLNYSGWLTKPFVVSNEGYYRFVMRRTVAPKDIGFIDLPNNYDPFMLIWNTKGKMLYNYKSADDSSTKMTLHRGMALLAPENTLPCFRMARKYGFTWIETDVWFTSDGYPVICHDATVDRTSDGSGLISSMTLAQLKALDFGSWFGSEWAGTRIPTLEEALLDSKLYGYKLQIEPKEDWTINSRAKTVVDLISQYGLEKDVMIAGFDGYTLDAVHALNEYIDLARTYTEITQFNVDVAKYLQGDHNQAYIMVYPITGITAANVHYAHDEHMPIIASITNTMVDIESLAALGVNRILTDSINLNDAKNNNQIF